MNNDQKNNEEEDRPGVTGKNQAAKEADGGDQKAVPESRNADAGGSGGVNSGKRARVFDLNAIFEETKKAAQVRGAETAAKREADEAAAEARGDRHSKSHPLGSAQSASGRSAESSQSGGGASGVDSGNATGADSDDDDDFMPILPPGFKPDTTVIKGADDKASSSVAAAESDDDDEFDDYNGEGIPIEQLIPAQFEASLKHGKKPVTCVAFDVQGLRLASGGADYVVNLFDFMKMDMMLRPERDMTPCESHVINSLSFNHNGEYLVVASGEPQLRILDRKGKQWAETIRGDQYLVDLTNTKGHTATINAIHFNPLIKQEFMTCSDDGTMRLWSLDDFKVLTKCINKHQKVIKTKTAGGKRAMPQCCAYSPDGKIVAAGCDDGSVQAWKYGTMYVNTLFLARTAHKAPITGIAFSPDSKRIVSRGLDDALRLWDVKQPKKFLHEVTGLENGWRNTDVGYSPRGEFIYTGTSAPPDSQTPGKLLFFNAENLELVYRIEYPGVSCIRMEWHARLNQILVGLSDGTMRVYYDQKLSQKGVMTCVTRPIRRKRTEEVVREEFVLSPLSLDMFQPRGEEGEEKEVTPWRIKKFLRIRDNKLRPEFRKPADMPLSGPSAGGKIAKSGSTLHSYLAQQIGTERNREFLEDTDVRASILRHAEEAEKNPQYISKAYRKTQPVPIFAEKTTAPEEEEADDELAPVFKMPKLA